MQHIRGRGISCMCVLVESTRERQIEKEREREKMEKKIYASKSLYISGSYPFGGGGAHAMQTWDLCDC